MDNPRVKTDGQFAQKGSSRRKTEWEKKYQQLVSYKQENGTCDVPVNHPLLGRWVKRQRSIFKDFELSKDEQGRRSDLGDGNWDRYDDYLRLKNIGFKFCIGRGGNQVGKKRGKYNLRRRNKHGEINK